MRASQDIPTHWEKRNNFFFLLHLRSVWLSLFFPFPCSLWIIRAWLLLLHHPRRSIAQIYREEARTGGTDRQGTETQARTSLQNLPQPHASTRSSLPVPTYSAYHTPPTNTYTTLSLPERSTTTRTTTPPPLDHGVSFRQEEGGTWS